LIDVVTSVAEVLRHSFKIDIIFIVKTIFTGIIGVYSGAMMWKSVETKYFNYLKKWNED
jgi:hypothetical protein